MAIVGRDVVAESAHVLVVLRDTNIGQRLGINQEIPSSQSGSGNAVSTPEASGCFETQPSGARASRRATLASLFDEEAPLAGSESQGVLTWRWMLDYTEATQIRMTRKILHAT